MWFVMRCSESDNSDEGNIARILIFAARSAEEHAVGSRNSWIPSYGSCEDQELQKVPVEKYGPFCSPILVGDTEFFGVYFVCFV